jgi:hypothetical protein
MSRQSSGGQVVHFRDRGACEKHNVFALNIDGERPPGLQGSKVFGGKPENLTTPAVTER